MWRSRSTLAQRRGRVWWTVAALGAVILTCSAIGLWRFVAFNLWAEEDAARLEPYPVVLVETADEQLSGIDRAVIEYNSYGRLVVHLSRGEVRYSLTRRRAWVKVYLETRHPADAEAVQRIKLLNTLDLRDGQWRVTSADWLTIP